MTLIDKDKVVAEIERMKVDADWRYQRADRLNDDCGRCDSVGRHVAFSQIESFISNLPLPAEPEFWYRVNTGDGPILCESLEECHSLLEKLNSGGSPELVEIREVENV